jgi:2-polyprenyl-3-methyl-5-hydroxy-6-metoxy-1,4-benzoquinol methylase
MQREDWDRKYAEVENVWATRPNRFLVAEASGLAPGRALDLACGEGQNAIWLAGLGWRVTGVDFSAIAIEKARARAARENVEVEFLCTDLLELRPEPEAYDLVIVLYLHIHSSQRRPALENACGAVAPGGTLLLVGHDLANLTEGVGGPSDPALLWTADEIASELPDGLVVEKAEQVLRDVDGEDRPAIDTLVRARRAATS